MDFLRKIIDRVAKEKALKFSLETNKDAMPPKEVIDLFCLQLNECLEPIGFKYYKSYREFRLIKGDWKLVVYVCTSRHNIRGEYVNLQIGNNIWNKSYTKWLSDIGANFMHQASSFPYEVIETGHKLIATQEWDIAGFKERECAFKEALYHIKEEIIPFFNNSVEREEMDFLFERDKIFFALYQDKYEKAKSLMKSFLLEFPEHVKDYELNLDNNMKKEFSHYQWISYPELFAQLCLKYGFGNVLK